MDHINKHPLNEAQLRKQAEEIAMKRAEEAQEYTNLSTEQAQKMLHELRVHQIELEMQNEELRRTQLELEATQARYFDLYDLAPVGYCTISEHGEILQTNLTAASLLGVFRGELVKQSISKFIIPTDQDTYYIHRKKLFETKQPQSFELQMVKGNGTQFWAQLDCTAALDDDKATVLRAIISDISRQKQLEIQLLQINTNLEELVAQEVEARRKQEILLMQQSRLAAMGEMIGSIAHQWRQPLNVLGLTIQELKEAYDFGELTKEYITNMIQKSMNTIEFMSHTIDDFRNFFCTTGTHEPFKVCDVVNETLSLVDSMFKNNFIEVSVACDNSMSLALVDGNRSEMKQVILNLLSNAKDAIMEQQQLKGKDFVGHVDIYAGMTEDSVFITFADNGGGISEEIVERIFEPYFTTKEQGQGTGIGLYMAKIITEKHFGGRLSVESAEDGTVFRVELKRAK